MGCRTGCLAAGSAHWTGTLELSGMMLFWRLLSCYPRDSCAGHCSEPCWHPVSPSQAPFPHLILHNFWLPMGLLSPVCSAHPLRCHLLASLSPSSASRSYTAPAFPQAPLPITSPLHSPASSAAPFPDEQNLYPPSHPPLHCLGPAPDTLPSPCFISSLGGFFPWHFTKCSVCLYVHRTAHLPPLSQVQMFPLWSQAQHFCAFSTARIPVWVFLLCF